MSGWHARSSLLVWSWIRDSERIFADGRAQKINSSKSLALLFAVWWFGGTGTYGLLRYSATIQYTRSPNYRYSTTQNYKELL